jgi:large subunit ribosomal protein L22
MEYGNISLPFLLNLLPTTHYTYKIMDIVQTQKFVRMSPRKLRLVADVVRELEPHRALDVLPHLGKRAATPIAKVIKTAIANAKQKGLSEGDLVFKEIQIGEGATLKRGRPVSRGRWHPIKKRMGHIRVVLMTTKSEARSPKSEKEGKRGVEKAQKVKRNTMGGTKKTAGMGRAGKAEKKAPVG